MFEALGFIGSGQKVLDLLEQFRNSATMCRADRENILKTECGKFVGSRLVFRVIDFVNEK